MEIPLLAQLLTGFHLKPLPPSMQPPSWSEGQIYFILVAKINKQLQSKSFDLSVSVLWIHSPDPGLAAQPVSPAPAAMYL